MTAISGVASAISVGAKKRPGRSARDAPPVTTRAPLATASAICARALSTWGANVIAPDVEVDVAAVAVRRWRRPLAQPSRPRPRTARRSARRPAPRRRPARCGCRPGRCARSRSTRRHARRAAGRRRPARAWATCRRARARPGSAARRRRARSARPTFWLPVKKIMSTCLHSSWPTSPLPVTTWKTSSGRPSSRQSASTRSDVSGVHSDGLSTTALPHASGATQSAKLLSSGQFQGPITPTTPRGW